NKRDGLLGFHQNKELEESGRYVALLDQYREALNALKLPLLGYVRQKNGVYGYFPDGSVGAEGSTELEFEGDVKCLSLHGSLPGHLPRPVKVTLKVGESSDTRVIKRSGPFSVSVGCSHVSGKCVPVTITSSESISGVDAGLNGDVRNISFFLE